MKYVPLGVAISDDMIGVLPSTSLLESSPGQFGWAHVGEAFATVHITHLLPKAGLILLAP